MRKLVSIFCLLLFAYSITVAQGYALKRFDLDDGLAGNTIYDIFQDSLAYLWFGTNNGLTRYDGLEFKNYNASSLQSSDILIVREILGRIHFINLNRQVFYLEGEKIIPADTSIFKMPIYDFGYDKKNQHIWYYNKQLVQYDISTRQKKSYPNINVTGAKGLRLFSTTEDGTVLIVTSESILSFDTTTQEIKPISIPSTVLKSNFQHLSNGAFLFPKQNNKIYDFNKKQWKALAIPTQDNYITGFVSSENYSWVLTMNNTYQINHENDKTTLFNSYLDDYRINLVFKDHEDNIWFGSNGNGLYLLSNPNIINFNTANSSISSNQIQKIEIGQDKTIWLGMSNGTILQHEENQFKAYKITDNKASFYDLKLNKQDLFIIVDKIYRFQQGKFQTVAKNFTGKTIAFDQDIIWVGTSAGLTKFNQQGKRLVSFEEPTRIYSLIPYADKLWIGSTKGLYYYERQQDLKHQNLEAFHPIPQNQFRQNQSNSFVDTSFLKPSSLRSENSPSQNASPKKFYDAHGDSIAVNIKRLVLTSDSSLWIATNNAGLYYLQNNTIHQFNESHGLNSNFCTDLFVDSDDNIWIATTKGLGKLSYPQLEYTSYSSEDGIISDGIITSIRRTTDSILYIGTLQGLSVVHERQLRTKSVPPKIHIRAVKINDKDTLVAKQYQLAYDQNNILIEFIGISYKSSVSYLYRLKKDGNWVASDNNSIRLTELSPGDYQLEIKAKTLNGIQSETPVTMDISILLPWWETLSFKILALVLLSFLISSIALIVVLRIKQKEQEKTSINKRFAELELQALQAQMNPHFVFNSLGAIQSFILDKDTEEASNYLARFAKLMRLFLDSSKEKYINLKDELELLRIYLELEKLRFGNRFDYSINYSPNVSPHTIEIPTMLIQPFVENAINHGLVHKKQEAWLNIKFSIKNNKLLQCIVEDNGIGRAAAAKRKQNAKGNYKSRGTTLVNSRLKVLNFIEATDINIDVSDRLDQKNEVCGTLVNILIPLEK